MVMDSAIAKVSIIVSKGSLEGIYPALIMANGARAEGIEANLFFTFFGLDAVTRKRHEHIRAAGGHPSLHLAAIIGSLSGMPGLMTSYLGTRLIEIEGGLVAELLADGHQAELTYLIGRHIGQLKARHQRLTPIFIAISAIDSVKFLQPFLAPYLTGT